MNQNRTVLHVDDDPAMLRVVGKILEAEGYHTVSLSDPTQVSLRLLESGARVVVLDIDMPDANGLDILEDLKRQNGGIQVIMLTGMVTLQTVLQSMMHGAEACIFKPITDTQPLLTALQAAFEKNDRWWESLQDRSLRKHSEAQELEMLLNA